MKRKNKKFEEDYFDGYYKNEVGEFSHKRDRELSNWFRGSLRYVNKFVPLKKSKGKSIIEFGCAYGAAAVVLKEYGLKVLATDISNLAVQRAIKIHPSINFKTHDIQKPFVGEKFDYAMAFDVLEHLEKPEIAIKSTYDLLRKGGTAIISTQNDFDYKVQDPTHISVKNHKVWKKLFLEAGFSDVKIKRVTFFPPYFYRLHWRFNFILPFASSTTWFLSTVFIFAKR
jgi:2-polyprenyl-3-methyl-5-hydroxy-6-metoxy-1,4-benzoquinol methylase